MFHKVNNNRHTCISGSDGVKIVAERRFVMKYALIVILSACCLGQTCTPPASSSRAISDPIPESVATACSAYDEWEIRVRISTVGGYRDDGLTKNQTFASLSNSCALESLPTTIVDVLNNDIWGKPINQVAAEKPTESQCQQCYAAICDYVYGY